MISNKLIIWFGLLFLITFSRAAFAELPESRFFHAGDGKLSLNSTHTRATFNGVYRTNGKYDQQALNQINKVFSTGQQKGEISLRLIEFLDYLQDHFQGGKITIVSGYRSPNYNTNLRNNGKLAAKASMHQYGLAADIIMQGVSSRKIWDYVKDINFGGVGYYYGKTVHIDVGPARFWDANTSGVGSGLADDNKLIIIINNQDIYLPGETINLKFARMTAWPIGVNTKFILENLDKDRKIGSQKIKPIFKNSSTQDKCQVFEDFKGMSDIFWQIPENIPAGRYQIKVKFCDSPWTEMPKEIVTDEFKIQL
ncbi:MAG: DUF882 domain-containing protein [Pseudomonadota bacterium]